MEEVTTVNIHDPKVLDCQIIETPEMMRLLKVDELDSVRRAVLNGKIPAAMDRLGTNRCQRWTVGMLREWTNFRAANSIEISKRRLIARQKTSPTR